MSEILNAFGGREVLKQAFDFDIMWPILGRPRFQRQVQHFQTFTEEADTSGCRYRFQRIAMKNEWTALINCLRVGHYSWFAQYENKTKVFKINGGFPPVLVKAFEMHIRNYYPEYKVMVLDTGDTVPYDVSYPRPVDMRDERIPPTFSFDEAQMLYTASEDVTFVRSSWTT